MQYEPAFELVNEGCKVLEEMLREYSDLDKLTASLTNPQKAGQLMNNQTSASSLTASQTPNAPAVGKGQVIYEGEKNAQGKYHGQGKLINENGSYQGEFKDGRYAGWGSFTYNDKRVSTGNWVLGKREGTFTTIWPDGKKLVGEYKKSMIQTGKMDFINGSWYEGTFIDNKFGKGKYFNQPKNSTYFG